MKKALLHVAFAALALSMGAALTVAAAANGPQQAPRTASASDPAPHFAGHMALRPTRGRIGSKVEVTGQQLPPNATFQLVWHTVKASWVMKGQYRQDFAGRRFQDVRVVLGQARSGPDGRLQASFTVPQGFGFDHTVTLERGDTVVNQALYTVEPVATIASTQGPPGSPIRITMEGIGARSYTNNWMLLYDNKDTGWISAVTTDGTAHVTIPAAGGPGKHVIEIIHGAYTFPYLNTKQSPHPKPEFRFTYTVTSAPPVLPPPLDEQGLPSKPGAPPSGSGAGAWVTPASGPTDAPVVLHARGLPAGQTVTLSWSRMVGSRVTSSGYAQHFIQLGTATVGQDGTLAEPLTLPADLGGKHTVRLVAPGGSVLARAGYTVTPTALSIEPDRGPAGTTFTLHIHGVGWTDTGNIYTVDYDNAYVGYACGFNSQGNVEIPLAATGRPGWHFITLYPSIYRGKDIHGTNDFRLPELTYAADHPGGRLPAFRFAFYVTAPSQP